MKPFTQEWLLRAEEDLKAVALLRSQPGLENTCAFHCQQCLEKSLKALIFEQTGNIPRIHDLAALYARVEPQLAGIDVEMLEEISDVYTDVRYPADIGYLPQGSPTNSDIDRFAQFTQSMFTRIQASL